MLGLNDDFRDLLAAFSHQAVRYLVVGAHAMAIPFIGREMLLVNKKASGRAKDLLDLELLEQQTR
jgi:hypothetical protein